MPDQDEIRIREFQISDLQEVFDLIWDTVNTCYPAVYSPEAITYWEDIHTKEKIQNDAKTGCVLVLRKNDVIIATGTLVNDRIGRVYVEPKEQGKGFGKLIMQKLQEKAKENGLRKVILHASLVSKKFYDSLGYETIRATFLEVKGKKLDYFDMEKAVF